MCKTVQAERHQQLRGLGAEEGTRTPTPLRVHGPEPCASANSATSASDFYAGRLGRLEGRCYGIYSTRVLPGVKPQALKAHLAFGTCARTDCQEPRAELLLQWSCNGKPG